MSRCRKHLVRSGLWYDERVNDDVVCNGKGNGSYWTNVSTRSAADPKMSQVEERLAQDRKVSSLIPGRNDLVAGKRRPLALPQS